MIEKITSHGLEEVYNSPTSPEKVEVTAKFIAQDLACKISDVNVLYKTLEELKSL